MNNSSHRVPSKSSNDCATFFSIRVQVMTAWFINVVQGVTSPISVAKRSPRGDKLYVLKPGSPGGEMLFA